MADLITNLERLGIILPKAPHPVASYIPAVSVHSGAMVFISGQIPFQDGKLIAEGPVPDPVSVEVAQRCARQCAINGLAALLAEIGDPERLRRVVRLGCFIACGPGFTEHSKVANGASDLLGELLGESGRHARAAVGVPSLPLNAPVEIEFTFLVD